MIEDDDLRREAPSHAFLALKARVEITRDARYAARKRLTRRNERAYYLISMLSLFVIVLSVIPNVHDFSEDALQWLLLLTIVNSVFIIVTTLVDVGENYALNAYQMQQSARQLDDVFNEIFLASTANQSDPGWLSEMHLKYQAILNSSPADQHDVDYLAVQVTRPDLFAYKWRDRSAFQKRTSAFVRFLMLHYYRSRWMIPHMMMVFASVSIVYDLWDGVSVLL